MTSTVRSDEPMQRAGAMKQVLATIVAAAAITFGIAVPAMADTSSELSSQAGGKVLFKDPLKKPSKAFEADTEDGGSQGFEDGKFVMRTEANVGENRYFTGALDEYEDKIKIEIDVSLLTPDTAATVACGSRFTWSYDFVVFSNGAFGIFRAEDRNVPGKSQRFTLLVKGETALKKTNHLVIECRATPGGDCRGSTTTECPDGAGTPFTAKLTVNGTTIEASEESGLPGGYLSLATLAEPPAGETPQASATGFSKLKITRLK